MLDICVLYFYHDDNAWVRRNLKAFRDSNPGRFLVPVRNLGTIPLGDNSVDVEPYLPCPSDGRWHGMDQMFYGWLRGCFIPATRYVLLEQDCRCTIDLRQYYAEVWDAGAAGATVTVSGNWLKDRSSDLPPGLLPYACALSPVNGALISLRAAEALRRLRSEDYPPGVFSEVRLGTLLNAAGFMPVQLPESRRATNVQARARPDFHEFPEPSLYHPAKSVY